MRIENISVETEFYDYDGSGNEIFIYSNDEELIRIIKDGKEYEAMFDIYVNQTYKSISLYPPELDLISQEIYINNIIVFDLETDEEIRMNINEQSIIDAIEIE